MHAEILVPPFAREGDQKRTPKFLPPPLRSGGGLGWGQAHFTHAHSYPPVASPV